jgi:HEAT repeat protein
MSLPLPSSSNDDSSPTQAVSLEWLAAAMGPLGSTSSRPVAAPSDNEAALNKPLRLKALRQLRHCAEVDSPATYRVVHDLLALIKQDPDPDIVHEALQTVACLKAFGAYALLLDIALGANIAVFEPALAQAHSPDKLIRIRGIAIRQLGLLGNTHAIASLMAILNERNLNYRLRLEAAEALGRLGDGKAVNPLILVAKDDRESSLYLKESAIKALGMLGDIRALDPLLEMFEARKGVKQKFQFIMEQALEAIRQIAQPHDERVLATLIKALSDSAPSIRLVAVEALGDLGDEPHIELLEGCLFDSDMEVAHAALAGIYKLGGATAVFKQLVNDNLPRFLRDEIERFAADGLLEPDDCDDDERDTIA